MKLHRTIFCALVTGSFSTLVSAQFNVTGAGPYFSNGPIGDAGNSTINATYSGANASFGVVNFSGDLTDGGVGTFASEANWHIRNLTAGGFIDLQPSSVTSFSGTINVTATSYLFGYGASTGNNFSLEAFESFDDAGLDATWNNVSFNFAAGPSITNIGTYASGTSFTMDTFTSNFDTEMALYSSAGLLLFNNDDSGGLQSMISPGMLADGTYTLVNGGYNSGFADHIANAGAAAGSLNVNINGTSVFTGNHAANTFDVMKFTVGSPVPEPASIAAIGLGLALLVRRRKK